MPNADIVAQLLSEFKIRISFSATATFTLFPKNAGQRALCLDIVIDQISIISVENEVFFETFFN